MVNLESDRVRGEKIAKHAEIVADANTLKAGSDYKVSKVRQAEADALAELMDHHDDQQSVADVDLPSDRLGDGDKESKRKSSKKSK